MLISRSLPVLVVTRWDSAKGWQKMKTCVHKGMASASRVPPCRPGAAAALPRLRLPCCSARGCGLSTSRMAARCSR
eukprot:362206-Chlamydomonas_euryale.AAC.4